MAYTLAQMRDKVRRRVDAYRVTLDVAGGETSIDQINPLISNEDILMYLNAALTKRSVDVAVNDNTILADSVEVDIVTDQVEYPLPEDIMFLRGLYWKHESITSTLLPPNKRTYMYEQDDDSDINEDIISDQTVPQYRRRLNFFVLDQVPKRDNKGGVLVDYVKSPLELVEEDQVLEIPLANILQEVIILDATIGICSERMKVDTSDIRTSLGELEARLQLAVLNYHAPKAIRMASRVVLVHSPVERSGKWSRSWRR